MSTIIVSVSTFLLIFATNTVGASTTQPKRSVANLIHHDSVLSPYYSPRSTCSDRVERSMKTSFARLSFLLAKTQRDYLYTNDYFQLNLLPSAAEPLFLVNFSIGQPPIPQLAVMDTGSSLLWVQCNPSQQKRGNPPVFNPSMSSTYASLSCNNKKCRHAPNSHCNSLKQCAYAQTYARGPPSIGILSTDQLIFESISTVKNVVFGCSHENGNYKDKRFAGVFGLGSDDASLATLMGPKFSYCIGNINDPQYSHNKLVLGDEPNSEEGYSTPLEIINGHYSITLEGISVGEKRLAIDPIPSTITESKQKGKSVIIDSGTALTWLAENEYKALDKEIRSLLDGFLRPVLRGSFLCYKGTVSQELIGFPVVTFHFAEGADLVLDTGSMFYQAMPDIFCMAVREAGVYGNEFKDFSVIGLMAQQYYNVAYDLDNYNLFLQRIDCELLD